MVIELRLYKKRKQSSGDGVIYDYDVMGSKKIKRAVVTRSKKGNHANIYYFSGRKEGYEYKKIDSLKRYISNQSK